MIICSIKAGLDIMLWTIGLFSIAAIISGFCSKAAPAPEPDIPPRAAKGLAAAGFEAPEAGAAPVPDAAWPEAAGGAMPNIAAIIGLLARLAKGLEAAALGLVPGAAEEAGAEEAAEPEAAALELLLLPPHGLGIASDTGPAEVSTSGTRVSELAWRPIMLDIASSMGAWMLLYIRLRALKPPGMEEILLKALS